MVQVKNFCKMNDRHSFSFLKFLLNPSRRLGGVKYVITDFLTDGHGVNHRVTIEGTSPYKE